MRFLENLLKLKWSLSFSQIRLHAFRCAGGLEELGPLDVHNLSGGLLLMPLYQQAIPLDAYLQVRRAQHN